MSHGLHPFSCFRERRAAEQVSSLQQDVESLQASVQELQLAAVDSGEERSKLRRELQEARRQLEDVHRDLETTSGTANETETQFRNEVRHGQQKRGGVGTPARSAGLG